MVHINYETTELNNKSFRLGSYAFEKKLLILNENNLVVPQFEKLLAAEPQISYEEYQGDLQDMTGYAKRLKDVDWIFFSRWTAGR